MITIRDVDPLDISIRMISGEAVPPWIYLNSSATAIEGTTLPQLVPVDGVINVNLNVIPGNDFGLEGNIGLLLEARDPKTLITKPITVRPKKSNTPSDFRGICWVNDRTFLPHPFSVEPQNVCTVIGTSQEQFFCRTNSSLPLSIPENELSKFIMCGAEKIQKIKSFTHTKASFQRVVLRPLTHHNLITNLPLNRRNPKDYYINPNSGSILATTVRTKSSHFYEWLPLWAMHTSNQNLLTFRATDGRNRYLYRPFLPAKCRYVNHPICYHSSRST